ncbi:MAG: site-specific integrase [Acidobacteriota bacterium]|nr:site-specific integrase [Acidobacteriota bacterium]
MPKTRRRGIIKKRGANSYLVGLCLGADANGKRLDHLKTIHGKKEAEQYLAKLIREVEQGTFVEVPKMTVSEFFAKWLETVSRLRASERTSYGHEVLFNRYFLKALGHKQLEKLHAMDIQKAYGEMLARGLSAQTVRHAHSTLRCALKQAVKWNLLPRNPAELVELPKVPRKERRVLSAEEAQRFITACEEMPRGLIFEVALLTGMRPEEYLALKWSDLDFERCTAQVRRAVVRHKKKWSFEETKTSKSRRLISLPLPLMRKLLAHKRQQMESRLKIGSEWQAHDLVFCSEWGTPLSIPNLTYRYFRPILERAKIPRIRLYDLRHSCATLLLLAEENPKGVSERLGHSTIVLTLDTYSHVLPTMQEKATARLERLLYTECAAAQ